MRAPDSIAGALGEKARAVLRRACGLDVDAATAVRAVHAVMAQARAGSHDAGEGAAAAAAAAAAWLERLSAADLASLVEQVVVPESWMFRDPEAFAAAASFIASRHAALPGRPQRILSLPCAGGEEPYTMAMALADAGMPANAARIEAMDVSAVALARARAGWYTRNAFRGADLAFRERHFSPSGSGYQISAALRAQVQFSQANLLAIDAAASAGRYDVIFCRNLLIYFDAPTVAAATAVLRTLLADDGLLLAGYAEVPQFCAHGFTPVRLPGAFALRKQDRLHAAPAPAPALAPRANPAPRRAVASAGLSAAAAAAPLRSAAAAAAAAAAAGAPAADPVPALLARARSQADSGDAAAAATCQQLLAAVDIAAGAPAPHLQAQAEAYYLLGLLADREQQSDDAARHWRRCVYLRPDHYEALCQLALQAAQAGDAGAAAVLRRRAARVHARRQEGQAP